jgi:hypothetical protein
MKGDIQRLFEFEYGGEKYKVKVRSTRCGDSIAELLTNDELIEKKKKQIDRFKELKKKIPYKV